MEKQWVQIKIESFNMQENEKLKGFTFFLGYLVVFELLFTQRDRDTQGIIVWLSISFLQMTHLGAASLGFQ